MIIGALDSTWPVLAAMKWNRTFFAMTATPLRAVDVVTGHMLWMTARVFLAVGAFAAVMMLFADTRTLGTLAAVPAGVLTGLAFAAPTFAWACTVENTGTSFAVVPAVRGDADVPVLRDVLQRLAAAGAVGGRGLVHPACSTA